MNTQISSLIEQYLQSIHQLMSDMSGEAPRDDLYQLIDQCVVSSETEPSTHAFFLAEQAFYHRRYKDALIKYLPLSHIPLHLFFCYRASAFLVASLGQHARAMEFAKRALVFQHHDLETLRLCKELAAFRTSEPAETIPEANEPSPTKLNVIALWAPEDGYYLRWNGLGIAINPGSNFLQKGHRLGDVDCVIVTAASHPEHNIGLQTICADDAHEGHQIHYYLIPESLQTLPDEIKRSPSMHPLNPPINVSEAESVILSDCVTLHYFSNGPEIGIRLTLERSGMGAINIGYLANSLDPSASRSQLQKCDLIIAGMGGHEAFSILDNGNSFP